MADGVAFLSLASPGLQALLMAFVAYPIALRTSGGMDRFRRSGFTWWLITLAVVVGAAAVWAPSKLSLGGEPQAAFVLICFVGGMTVVLVELAAEQWSFHHGTAAALAGRARYDAALPRWATGLGIEIELLVAIAILEEAAYRGVALGTLTGPWGLSDAAGILVAAVAFGAAHYYFGVWQVGLKFVVGIVFGVVAVTTSWVVAAAAHATVNLVLVGLARRAEA